MRRVVEMSAQKGSIKVKVKASVSSPSHVLTSDENKHLRDELGSELMKAITTVPFCQFKLIDIKVK